jgi:hypothetical protein
MYSKNPTAATLQRIKFFKFCLYRYYLNDRTTKRRHFVTFRVKLIKLPITITTIKICFDSLTIFNQFLHNVGKPSIIQGKLKRNKVIRETIVFI